MRVPKVAKEGAYNRVLAHRSELQERLNAMHANARKLVARWLESKKDQARPVSTEGLTVRLRLDEGSGEALKNSAPSANPASFQTTTMRPRVGRDYLAVARLPNAVEHASAAGAGWRLRSEPCVLRRWLVHVQGGAVSSRKLWNTDFEDGIDAA